MVHQLFLANTLFDATVMQGKLPDVHEIETVNANQLIAGQRSMTTDEGEKALQTFTELQPTNEALLRATLLALVRARPLPKVPLPDSAVVVIDDDHDPSMPAPMRYAVRERHAGSLQLCIQGGGHQPAIQRPHTVATLLLHRLTTA